MHNAPDAGHLADYPPQVVLQILLANNLTSYTGEVVPHPVHIAKLAGHSYSLRHRRSCSCGSSHSTKSSTCRTANSNVSLLTMSFDPSHDKAALSSSLSFFSCS